MIVFQVTNLNFMLPTEPLLFTMAAFDKISDLKPFKSMRKINVKSIRLRKQYSISGGEKIEMVLMDSQVGFKIVVFKSIC